MVATILIVGIGAKYDFVPDGQTERLSGQKVHFIMTDAGISGDGAGGFAPSSASLPLDKSSKIKQVPCRVTASFSMTVKDGKPTLKLADVDEASIKPFKLD